MISFLYCQARSVRASLDQLTFNPFNPFNPFMIFAGELHIIINTIYKIGLAFVMKLK